MFNQLMIAKDYAKSFIQDKRGAVAFEYVLIIGGISVVVIAALTLGGQALFPQLITATCAAIDTIVATMDCTGI